MTPPAALRIAGASLVCALSLAVGAAPPASAEDAAAARADARQAAIDVSFLLGQLGDAQEAFTTAYAAIGERVADSVLAQSARTDSMRAADHAAVDQAKTARAVYMGGGHSALVATVLGSRDSGELARRVVAIDRVLDAARVESQSTDQASAAAEALADAASVTADQSVVTASVVAERAVAVDVLMTQAQVRLDQLSARARQMTEAEAAAKALARARAKAAADERARAAAAAKAAAAAVAASTAAERSPTGYGPGARVGTTSEATFFDLYRAAAPTCPGMHWTLLAAVGQVESRHGRNNGPSSAGAIGPMQFMPRTFAGFAVDGDQNGRADPWSPADAVYTAARYLCSNGAGNPETVQRALFSYNRAQWYVDLVLGVQAQIAASAQ